jgi:CDP-6-deoxy-D-xylo-4-hexulose-3-dehydrase
VHVNYGNNYLNSIPSSSPEKVNQIPYAGRVYDEDEIVAAVETCLDYWLTLGKNGKIFENNLSKYLNTKSSVLTNSGSSANLLAVSALTSFNLKEKRIKPSDEVITVAAGFPTTVAPLIQNNMVPVFIDISKQTLNADVQMLEEAFIPGKTRAIFLAHTLGNPFDLDNVLKFCKRNDLWLIEDNCDALGSLYDGKLTGSFGDLSTQSFYPPHHITMGEGGAVNIVKKQNLRKIVESFRDWGRDCWCESGKDNTCGKRFDWKLGDLPEGYDHKFTYSHLGYNLKPLDIQAAIGIQQLKKLQLFINERINNWNYLRKNLNDLENLFDFMLPTHAISWSEEGFVWEVDKPKTTPSWFGFMLSIKPEVPFTKRDFSSYLDIKKIGNRSLFGGNLTRQPAFINLLKDNGKAYRVIGSLSNTDHIMNNAVCIGVYPVLNKRKLDYIIECIYDFCKRFI